MLQRLGIILLLLSPIFAESEALAVPLVVAFMGVSMLFVGRGANEK